MAQSKAREAERHDWTYFVALSGEEGARWAEAYRSAECREVIRWTNRSLALLRQEQIDPGKDLMARVEARSSSVAEAFPSLRPALDRLYHSAMAYYFYRIGSAARAQEALTLAHQAVKAAIEWRDFLLPLANHCYDFCLQRARIARNERRWLEMEGYIEEGRAMLDNKLPLCRLGNGRPIYLATVDDFYRSLPLSSDADRSGLEELIDESRRRHVFEMLADSTYAPPWLAIPYP